MKNLHMKPYSSIKTRFAVKFLRAMKKLNKNRPPLADKHKRYHAIKAAACASMASSVGPKKVWSRTLLRKIRNHRSLINKTRSRGHIKRKRILRGNPRKEFSFGEEDDLRGLVPGGQGMDICRLLSETAHYVKCLAAQVEVMTNILHHYST